MFLSLLQMSCLILICFQERHMVNGSNVSRMPLVFRVSMHDLSTKLKCICFTEKSFILIGVRLFPSGSAPFQVNSTPDWLTLKPIIISLLICPLASSHKFILHYFTFYKLISFISYLCEAYILHCLKIQNSMGWERDVLTCVLWKV